MFETIKRIFKKKKEVVVPLDPEKIRTNEQIQALAQELQGARAELSNIKAKQREEKEKELQGNYEEQLKEKLNEEEKRIKENKFSGALSLKKFFFKYFNDNKFRRNLEYFDANLKAEGGFGKFGDLLVLKNGDLATQDSDGNILTHGECLRHVFFKPGNLLNSIERTGKILLPVDSDFEPVIDWEEEEIENVKYDYKEKVFKETAHARRKAKEKVMSLIKEAKGIKDYADRIENLNIGLQKEIDDLKRANKFLKTTSETYKSELSQAMDSARQFHVNSGSMQKQITDLTELKSMYEQRITILESTVKSLLKRIEQSGDITLYEQAKEDTKSDLEWARNVLPNRIIEREIKIEKQENVASAGVG